MALTQLLLHDYAMFFILTVLCSDLLRMTYLINLNKQIHRFDIPRLTGFVDWWEVKKYREGCM